MIAILFIFTLIFIIILFTIKKFEHICPNKEGMFSLKDKIPSFPISMSHITNSLSKNIHGKNKSYRLLCNIDSQGLKHDAQIYNSLIDNSYVCCFYNKSSIPPSEINKLVDVNIHFEKLMWPPKSPILPAKQNWFVINQELLYENLSDLLNIDKFLCKSKYAFDLLSHFKLLHHLPADIIYVGHTSSSISPYPSSSIQKDFNLFTHTAGQSAFKNTPLLLSVWKDLHIKYPNIKLMFTCKDYCKMMVNDHSSFNSENSEKYGIIYKPFFENDEYRLLTQSAVCNICPSYVEGYGHYINEGRANSCAIITTDGPPMNELVVDGKNGFLIKNVKKIPSKHVTHFYTKYIPDFISDTVDKLPFHDKVYLKNSNAYLITYKGLYDTIEKFINLKDYQKMDMCDSSRKMYVLDTYRFQKNLDQLL